MPAHCVSPLGQKAPWGLKPRLFTCHKLPFAVKPRLQDAQPPLKDSLAGKGQDVTSPWAGELLGTDFTPEPQIPSLVWMEPCSNGLLSERNLAARVFLEGVRGLFVNVSY